MIEQQKNQNQNDVNTGTPLPQTSSPKEISPQSTGPQAPITTPPQQTTPVPNAPVEQSTPESPQSKQVAPDITKEGTQEHEVGGVTFQEEIIKQQEEEPTIKILQWEIKYSGGMIKNEKQAVYVVLGVVGLSSVITIYLFLNAGNLTVNIETPEGQQVIYPQGEPPRLQSL